MAFLEELADERAYQRMVWGDAHDDAHPISAWVAILVKHVGRLAWEGAFARSDHPAHRIKSDIKDRLVTIAAICQAAYEAIERSES